MSLPLVIYKLEPQVKLKNSFAVHFHEGIFVDHNQLVINDDPILNFKGSLFLLRDRLDFIFHDKPYQFCYNYTWYTGKPRSFIVLQNNRVLAQYGDDSALRVKANMKASID